MDEYKKTIPLKQAVQKAIDECKKLGIMADYLEKKGNEVFDMMAFQWNEEEARQAWEEYGRKEGREEGREEGIILSIKKMMTVLQLSARKAMEVLDIPPAEYERQAFARSPLIAVFAIDGRRNEGLPRKMASINLRSCIHKPAMLMNTASSFV